MKDRIRRIQDLHEDNQQTFAAKLGISPASLSSIYTGRTRPTINIVEAIHRHYPEVNFSWLMFGKGEMLNEDAKPASSTTQSEELTFADMQPNNQAAAATDSRERSTKPASRSAQPTAKAPANPATAPLPLHDEGITTVAKNMDKRQRHIKEIRVFYDDGTYEAFTPGK